MKKLIFLFTILLMILMPTIVNADTDLTIMPINTSEWGDATLLESDGNYLLMDVTYGRTNDIINFLKSKNVTKFDLYLSHYHSDHYGALDVDEYKIDGYTTVNNASSLSLMEYLLLKEKNSQYKDIEPSYEYEIENLYLPDPSICFEYNNRVTDGNVCHVMYKRLSKAAEDAEINVVILGNKAGSRTVIDGGETKEINVHNTFQLGKTTAEVLYIADELADIMGEDNAKNDDYVKNYYAEDIKNNMSLVTMFTTNNGNKKFLTAGDIEDVTENKIISIANLNPNFMNKIKDVDIYKMSHHGLHYETTTTKTWYNYSNTQDFINIIKPKYSYSQFKLRLGEPGKGDYSDSSLIIDAIDNLSEYSNIYIPEENGDISFVIENGVITPVVKKGDYSITINYKDKENDQILDTRTYYFNSSLFEDNEKADKTTGTNVDEITGIKYHLYDYEKEFDGYKAEPNNNIQTSGVLTNNLTYDIYYTKQLANPKTGFNMGYELLIPIVLICGITYVIIRKK